MGQCGEMSDRRLIRNRAGLGRNNAFVGRRMLDLAEGVLIGLRGYSAEDAFAELVAVAQRHDASVSAIASALLDLASGSTDAAQSQPAPRKAAQLEWGHLVVKKLSGPAGSESG